MPQNSVRQMSTVNDFFCYCCHCFSFYYCDCFFFFNVIIDYGSQWKTENFFNPIFATNLLITNLNFRTKISKKTLCSAPPKVTRQTSHHIFCLHKLILFMSQAASKKIRTMHSSKEMLEIQKYRLFGNEREFLAIKTMARNSLSFPNSLYVSWVMQGGTPGPRIMRFWGPGKIRIKWISHYVNIH